MLPFELLYYTFHYLDTMSVINISRTCQYFNSVIQSKFFYHNKTHKYDIELLIKYKINNFVIDHIQNNNINTQICNFIAIYNNFPLMIYIEENYSSYYVANLLYEAIIANNTIAVNWLYTNSETVKKINFNNGLTTYMIVAIALDNVEVVKCIDEYCPLSDYIIKFIFSVNEELSYYIYWKYYSIRIFNLLMMSWWDRFNKQLFDIIDI